MQAVATETAFEQYDQLINERDAGNLTRRTLGEDATEDTTHYLWHAGDNIPYEQVVRGEIVRGRVTPVLRFPKWEPFLDVPEGMRVAVRGSEMGELGVFRPAEAQMFIKPGPIFNSIMEMYRAWGVTELSALEGWPSSQAAALNIDKVFFPNGFPATHKEIRARIKEVAGELKGNPDYETYKAIALDMLKAVDAAEAYDKRLVDEVEANIERSKSDASYQSYYCATSMRAMARTERTRKDEQLNAVARNQAGAFDAIPKLLEALANQSKSSGIEAGDLVAAVEKVIEAKTPKAPAPAAQKPVDVKKSN